jgi:hypothetical protein
MGINDTGRTVKSAQISRDGERNRPESIHLKDEKHAMRTALVQSICDEAYEESCTQEDDVDLDESNKSNNR